MSTLIAQTKSSGELPKFRVWHAFNGSMDYLAVDSLEEAETLIARLIRADLEDTGIYTNAFGLEELEADGYHEWADEDGKGINERIS